MIEGLKPHPTMKDSGHRWLGEVPEHWGLRRMKTLLRERVEKGFPEQPLLAATQAKGVVLKEQYENRTVLPLKDLHLLKLVRIGDFVISLRSFQGGIEYARVQGIISPAYTVLYPADPATHSYLAILFKSQPYIENLSLYVTGIRQGQNIDYEKLGRAELPLPPLPEQAPIVHFLDHADRKIRRYIRTKQKLIKLLEEQKQAVIHRAVTLGLDPNVRLKPSGVEWLGEVPEHWDLRPAKWFFREIDQRSTTGDEELLSVSHLTGVTPRSEKKITMFMAESYSGHKLCRAGDLVINTMWAWMGALGISRQIGIVSPAYGVYRPYSDCQLLAGYADLLLRTRPYIAEYNCRSTGIQSSRLRLYPEQFLRVPIVCPPREEQLAIIAHVSADTAEVSRIIALARREIDLLREYRTRLTADVVTGKLDVREEPVQLPDEGDAPDDLEESVAEDEADDMLPDDETDADPDDT